MQGVILILVFFSPAPGNSVDIGIVEVTDIPLSRYEYVGEPIQEGNLTLYPLLTGWGLYSYDKLDWVLSCR